jgi:hypothetical protein
MAAQTAELLLLLLLAPAHWCAGRRRDGQPGTMLAFALAVLQRLVRRLPQDGRPCAGAAQLGLSENPLCFEDQRIREERLSL